MGMESHNPLSGGNVGIHELSKADRIKSIYAPELGGEVVDQITNSLLVKNETLSTKVIFTVGGHEVTFSYEDQIDSTIVFVDNVRVSGDIRDEMINKYERLVTDIRFEK